MSNPTEEQVEAAAKIIRRASLETTADPGDFWSDCYEGEREAWRNAARAALVAAARVPVQGEPNDDQEARVKRIILESLVFTNENSEPWAQLLAENILAALVGAPEPEWEYRATTDSGSFVGESRTTAEHAVQALQDAVDDYPLVLDEVGVRVERRPRSTWLPVEGEKP